LIKYSHIPIVSINEFSLWNFRSINNSNRTGKLR